MASSTNVNFSNIENAAGMDIVVNNARVRALTNTTNALGTLYMQGTGTPTAFTTGNQTLTAANLLTGIITGAPAAGVNYTTDTAAAIITAMQNASAGVQVGDYLEVLLCNDAVAANTITVVGGTGVTVNRGTNAAIAGGVSVVLMFRITSLSASTMTVYY